MDLKQWAGSAKSNLKKIVWELLPYIGKKKYYDNVGLV
jgi:hypothetical protein